MKTTRSHRLRPCPLVALIAAAASLASHAASTLTVCDEAALRRAVARGGLIQVRCAGTITLASPLRITNEVILDATGVRFAVSGAERTRLFEIESNGVLVLTNVWLADGRHRGAPGASAGPGQAGGFGEPAFGGAILNHGGTVRLISCVLSNNEVRGGRGGSGTAVNPFSGSGGAGAGGAVFNSGGSVLLDRVYAVSNRAIGGASGLFSSGAVHRAGGGGEARGGVVCNSGGTVIIANSLLTLNSCVAANGRPAGIAQGGAVFHETGVMVMRASRLQRNRAEGSGATGVANWVVTLPAGAKGGGVAVRNGSATIEAVEFSGNVASGGFAFRGSGSGLAHGGALFNAAALNLRRVLCASNIALSGGGSTTNSAASGGGLFNLGEATLREVWINGNRSMGGGNGLGAGIAASGLGGGIFNGGELTATNVTIALNAAEGGKASYEISARFERGMQMGADASGRAAGSAYGGGIYSTGAFVFASVTLASNAVAAGAGPAGLALGAELVNSNGAASLHRTLIASTAHGSTVVGAVQDGGFNRSSDPAVVFDPPAVLASERTRAIGNDKASEFFAALQRALRVAEITIAQENETAPQTNTAVLRSGANESGAAVRQ